MKTSPLKQYDVAPYKKGDKPTPVTPNCKMLPGIPFIKYTGRHTEKHFLRIEVKATSPKKAIEIAVEMLLEQSTKRYNKKLKNHLNAIAKKVVRGYWNGQICFRVIQFDLLTKYKNQIV